MGLMAGRFTISRARWKDWRETLQGKMAASAALHVLILLFAANAWWFGARKMKPVGSPSGSRHMMVYNASKTFPQASSAYKAPIHTVRPARTLLAAPAQVPDLQQATAPGSEQALGNGEVSIRYVQAFPAEKPDLAGAGATGDIKLDVLIDETGHIARIRARTGMTPSIDRMVIATVEQWVFQPAMRDGHPVSTSEELHFHYDRARNPVNCGWDCFTLEAE
jgi:protein TonB